MSQSTGHENTKCAKKLVFPPPAGERISMPPMVGILFEVQDLAVASPATVSRTGMVYFDYPDLGVSAFIVTFSEKLIDFVQRYPQVDVFAPHPSFLQCKF